MRIVSLVPSWTETLLAAEIPLVGRTRFCIHPKAALETIPVVGGTKNIDWKTVNELRPDVLILDKEENPKEFFDEAPCPCIVTHVENLSTFGEALELLHAEFASPKLASFIEDFKKLEIEQSLELPVQGEFPGHLEWLHAPSEKIKKILYVIWKNPWMSVSKKTFIGSNLEYLFGPDIQFEFAEKYPNINIEEFADANTALFYSSEPYPFAKKKRDLPKLECPQALVDGESFSWYGVRSLRFLLAAKSFQKSLGARS